MTGGSSGGAAPGWYPEPGTGRLRWWDGRAWGDYRDAPPPMPPVAPASFGPPAGYVAPGYVAPGYVAPAYVAVAVVPQGNGMAVAALVLGIWAFCVTWIPLFIGLILGGIPAVLAIAFGIAGIARSGARGGQGLPLAIVGLVLGGLAFFSIFLGAGTLW